MCYLAWLHLHTAITNIHEAYTPLEYFSNCSGHELNVGACSKHFGRISAQSEHICLMPAVHDSCSVWAPSNPTLSKPKHPHRGMLSGRSRTVASRLPGMHQYSPQIRGPGFQQPSAPGKPISPHCVLYEMHPKASP